MKQVQLHVKGWRSEELTYWQGVRLRDCPAGGFENEDTLIWHTKRRRFPFTRHWVVTGCTLYDNGSEMGEGPFDVPLQVKSGDEFSIPAGALKLFVSR